MKSLLDFLLSFFFARRNRREPRHLFRIIFRWLLAVVEPPGVTQPPGGPETVPEVLATALLGCKVAWKLALQELFPGALKITLRSASRGNLALCAHFGECIQKPQQTGRDEPSLLCGALAGSALGVSGNGMLNFGAGGDWCLEGDFFVAYILGV